MVAYSFKKRFIDPIKAGLGTLTPSTCAGITPKRQTIRAERARHARPGETLQLYCGMRTKQCFKIGEAKCTHIRSIILDFEDGDGRLDLVTIDGEPTASHSVELDAFAIRDGFSSWSELTLFWREEHPGDSTFSGVLIEWEPL